MADINKLMELNEVDNLKSQNTDEKLQILMDIISVDRVPSDKVGYEWEVIKVGDLEVKKTYIKQDNPKGTADNPYTDKSVLVNNAFYLIDGVRYVYMDGEFVEF